MEEPLSSPSPTPVPGSTAALAAQLFAAKSEDELLYLAQHAGRYPPAVGAAAVAELKRRGLLPEPASLAPAAPPRPAETWGEVLRDMFLPSRHFFATPSLVLANLLVFVLLMLLGGHGAQPTGHELVQWGSNFSSLTLHGQPWRLVSSLFLHSGPMHLMLNMFSLWLLGVLIEPRLGGWRLLAGYFLSGIGACLASLGYHSEGINSVGASGAIFGLYGLFITLLVSRRLSLDKSNRQAMFGLVVYLALSNLVSGFTGDNIDNAAHVGGLLTGLLAAGPLVLFRLKTKHI